MIATLAVTVAALLAPRWNGRRSEQTLSYAEAFSVLVNGHRSADNRRGAQTVLRTGVYHTIEKLQALRGDDAWRGQADLALARLRAALAGPGGEPSAVTATGRPLEELLVRLGHPRRLTATDLARALELSVAGVRLLQASLDFGPEYEAMAHGFLRQLAALARDPAAKNAK